MSSLKILVVDDEKVQTRALLRFFKKLGYEVQGAFSFEEAILLNEKENFDIALIDLRIGDKNGIDLLSILRERNPLIKGIIITAFGTIDSAVKSMKEGAVEFLTKPVNLNEIAELIRKIEDEIGVEKLALGNFRESEDFRHKGIVFKSSAMKKVLTLAYKTARSMAPVLVTGESGTGKEEIARFIHNASGRIGKFVAISCASIPENLLESELFGYERGAFTGADTSRKGKIEIADGGTLFLDEIGEMSPSLQAKLLRFLESGEYWKLGSDRVRKANIRLISATNRDLLKMIEEGKFREDLFYRINTVHIKIPPLRERREDIIPLSEYFLKVYSKKMHKLVKGFTKEAKYYLLSQDYRGNVRELRNMIERAVVLVEDGGYISVKVLSEFSGEGQRVLLKLKDVEKEHIKKVLLLTDWNIKEAARILGIHRNTLSKKMKEYFAKKDT